MFKIMYFIGLIFISSISITYGFTAKFIEDNTRNRIKEQNPVPQISNFNNVKTILLEKMDNNYISSKDGQSYHLNRNTIIIDNTNTKNDSSKIKIAELFFYYNTLVAISIK